MTHTEVADMRGRVVRWDGKHGIIQTDDGIEVDFFPIHLVATGYVGRVKVGDRIYFRCNVINAREYCLETIKAVALS